MGFWTTLWSVSMVISMTRARPNEQRTRIEYLMPKVQPQYPDTYLCVPMQMNKTTTNIVGFVPHADKAVAHHILLYGCIEPGYTDRVWNCGEMNAEESTGKYDFAPTCKSGNKILYAWANDAPMLHLPEDVAFQVGGDTDIKWLALQVHYKNVEKFLKPTLGDDSSGITMITTKQHQPKRAGVYLLGTGGNIPAHTSVYMETACMFEDEEPIHPFAYRIHAHGFGKVTAGYRIRDGEWTEIGRKSPALPQMFYNATTPNLEVAAGDILAARCTFVDDLDHDVAIGSTQHDEMCNFYIMYYVNGDHIMKENYCFSAGPPKYYWEDSYLAPEMNLEAKPDDMSIIPGTDEVIPETAPHYKDKDDRLHNLLSGMDREEVYQLLSGLPEEPEEEYDEEYQGQYIDPYPRFR